jgi:hypothetical protein
MGSYDCYLVACFCKEYRCGEACDASAQHNDMAFSGGHVAHFMGMAILQLEVFVLLSTA